MPPTNPFVTVIVPCYRATEFITETLDSLRAQIFRNFETILINDGCPDTSNLERVLAPYENEIVYIRQENQGPSGARNTGIRKARGELIALLDSDDVWNPDYLQVQVEYLAAHPGVDVVYPNAVFIGESVWTGRIYRDMLPSRGEVTVASLLTRSCSVSVSVTAHAAAFKSIDLFDTELRWGEDWDVWLRMTKNGSRIAYHDQVLYQYRLRKDSLSDDRLALARSGVAVLSKFLKRSDLTGDERSLALGEFHKSQAQLSFLLGRIAAYRKNRREAIVHLVQANKLLKNWRLTVAVIALRVAPSLLFHIIHRRYSTEYEFIH